MSKDAKVYIEYSGTRIVTAKDIKNGAEVGSFTFVPGNNIIDAKLYNIIKKDLALKFKTKEFKELHPEKKDGKDGMTVSKDFSQMSMDDAEKFVGNINDSKVLKELKQGESRDAIRAAISSKIEDLEKFKKKGKKQKEV